MQVSKIVLNTYSLINCLKNKIDIFFVLLRRKNSRKLALNYLKELVLK